MVDAVQPPTKSKKNKKPKTAGVSKPSRTTGEGGNGLPDIKSLIHEHCLFFDNLVELIPAKFYLPKDAQDKPWFQGLSRGAKAEAKQKSIENTKKSRRERLDPEKASKTTLDLLKETLDNEKSKGVGFGFGDAEEEDREKKSVVSLEGDDRSVTYEELRQRLHRKIEELRAGRGGGVNEGKRDERRERKEGKKRKRDEEEPSRKVKEGKNESEEEKERDFEKDASEAAEGIRFGKLKLGGNEERDGKNKKKKEMRKLSKEKELERALKMEKEAKNDPEIAKKQAWKVAMERAHGKKVHDDPRKLKESIKREKKKQKKSTEKWKERMENVETKKQERQDKRKENIKAKIDQKKMRKIERREKKLMRPGFEGRKEGFIN